MKKISSINILSVLLVLIASPYIALPRVWKEFFLVAIGLAILIISILLRRELNRVLRIVHEAREVRSDTYVENNPK